jgi:hypothetical protein
MEELWFYILFTTIAVVAVTLVLQQVPKEVLRWPSGMHFSRLLQSISTTGFATTDYKACLRLLLL